MFNYNYIKIYMFYFIEEILILNMIQKKTIYFI